MTPEYKQARVDCSLRYLSEVRELAIKHRANDLYIKSLYEDAQGIGGIDYTRDLVSATKTPDKLPNSVVNLIEMKAEAEALAEEYTARKREARALLDQMDGTYGRLLLLRYCTVLPWSRVAEALNYREDYCRAMRNDALCEFYDFLPHAYRMPEQPAI